MIDLKILWILVGVLFTAFVVTGIIHFNVKKKSGNKAYVNESKARMHLFYQKSYILFLRIPGLRRQIERIKLRLSTINPYDEMTLRKETMKITLKTLLLLFLGVDLFALFSRSLMGTVFAVMGAILINSLLITHFVKKEEDRLLVQLTNFLEEQRHEYQDNKRLEESMYRAAQNSAHTIKLQIEKIHKMLTSKEPEKELDAFYNVAPNRYLKIYAGVSHLVMEYGDRNLSKGSMYLNALNKMVREIRDDLLRRSRLSYRLNNLTIMALLPILLTFPIVLWAETFFPVMREFYSGTMGYILRLVIYAASIICYLLVRKVGELEDAKYIAPVARKNWEEKVYRIPVIKRMIDLIVPSKNTKKHHKITSLLKQSNSPLLLEWFYIQRIVVGLACFILVVSLSVFLHWNSVQQVKLSPTLDNVSLVGALNAKELQEGVERTKLDNQVIESIEGVGQLSREIISKKVSELTPTQLDGIHLNNITNRIIEKIMILENAYFKWYELLVAIGFFIIGLFIPVWILMFQRKMRAMEMQNEVDQFHTLISILCEFERVSVQIVLEWMERYALIFKTPLKKCLNNYDRGAEKVLVQLKEDAPFSSFGKIVNRLMRSVEKISVKEAFDDLEMQQEYHREQKIERMNRLITKKVAWGRIFGWTPIILLIALFLLFPMLYVSFKNMGELMINLQNLT
ncbi:hypothetical protein RB298_04880 [Priestia sp. BR_2]